MKETPRLDEVPEKQVTDPRRIAWRITQIYLAFGVLWILSTDRLVAIITHDKDTITLISTIKGWGFILVTAALLFFLIINYIRRIEKAEKKVLISYQTLKSTFAELEKAHSLLAESEARYRLISEGVNDGLWDLDIRGGFQYHFTRHKEMLGYEEMKNGYQLEEYLGFIHPEDLEDVKIKIQEHLDGVTPYYQCEYRIRNAFGEYVWFLSRGKAVRDDKGNAVRMAGSHTDITERKRNESQIVQLNQTLEQRVAERTNELNAALKEIESFSYSVSHDLCAPLRSIDGFSQVLFESNQEKLDDDGKYYLNKIRASTKRMGQLIDELLSLSRLGRSEMKCEMVDLACIAKTVMQQLNETDRSREVVFHSDENALAFCDRQLIYSVLENLLGNAWKFTGKKEKAEITFGVLNKESGPVYFVRDNGVGFEMAYSDKLFKPFQRLHRADEFTGNGIGLANVSRIIRRHGGRIWGESIPGEGAVFYFTLREFTIEFPLASQG